MNRRVANTVIGCAAFMALLVGLSVHRILSPGIMTTAQLSEMGLFVYEVPRRFADFSLVDHDGEAFTKADLEGRWTLIFFGFTSCPDICPLTMAHLSRFSEMLEGTGLEEDTQVVMVSVDPQRDTPEKLEQYVHYFNEDFIGATGEYIEIFNLTRQLNVAFGYLPGEDGEYLVTHSGEVILINPEGHFHGFFKAPQDPARMLETYSSVRESYAR